MQVHRSVQILRDKQELADTQKELAKLQLAQKESSSSQNSQQNEERSSTPDTKKNDNSGDSHGQQLALALPSQVAPPHVAPQPQRAPQPTSQPQAYYLPPAPVSSISGPTQLNQTQYQQPQMAQTQPLPQIHSHPQYQQQWAQQVPPQPSMPPVSRPPSPQVYPPYLPSQPVNPSPPEPLPNSMPMQMQYSGIPPTGPTQAMTYAYSGTIRTSQPQQPPQHLKPTFGGQPGDGYAAGGPSQGNAYLMYDSEPGRVQHPSQAAPFPQGGYPPNPQQTTGGSMMSRPAQFTRNHPYNELFDKLVSMGYRGDHVMSVIQRLDETGQTVDFNAVLDRLNGHSSGGPQRGWSG